MSEENDNFKLNSASENPVIDGKIPSGGNTTTAGAPEINTVWASPAPPVDDFNYFFNSALGFQQNGYFFQNFGPPPNIGKSVFCFTECGCESQWMWIKY